MEYGTGVSLGVLRSATKHGGFKLTIGDDSPEVIVRVTLEGGVIEIDTYLPGNEFATSTAKFNVEPSD